MSNNIYDIMKKLNAVESIDAVATPRTKNTTLLEATMQEVLSEKYMGFKTAAGKKLGENAKLSERVSVGSNTDLDAADFPMPGNKLSPKDQYSAIMKDVDHVQQSKRGLAPSVQLQRDSDKGRFAAPGLGDQGQFFQEDDMEEGNLFTGNLAKARAAGKKRADLDGDGDMETVKEQGVMEEKKTTKTGTVHKAKPGRYGGYNPETDPDKDEDDKKSEPAVKRGRGRPKKNADSDTGEVKKWDTSALQSAFGSSAPKKLPGKASVKHKMKDDDKDDKLDEVAPPGKKAERMVKNIKKGYAKDGKLTDKEKGIAYATTWKARNKGKVEESIPPGFPKSLAKKIYEQCDGDMKNTLSTMWKVYNSVMESKNSSKKKISEGMKFEQSTTKPAMGTYKGGVWTADPPKKGEVGVPVPQDIDGGSAISSPKQQPSKKTNTSTMGTYKGGVWTADPPKKGEVGVPVPSPDEGAPVKQQSKRRPQKEDVSENKELNDVLKLAGIVDESVKVDECGMSPISGSYGDTMQDSGRMSINTNMSTDGNKTVTITADGDSAVELMQMLKMAGMDAKMSDEDTDMEKMSEEKDDRYEANTTPEEEVLPVQTQLKGGNGEVAGKEKKMTPHGYKFADNPLAMTESMTLKLMKEYESIKKVK
jgi:hypothetical protein